jgi:hypothetical protein
MDSFKKDNVCIEPVINGLSEDGAKQVVMMGVEWNLNYRYYKKPNWHILVKYDTAEEFTTALIKTMYMICMQEIKIRTNLCVLK